MTVCKLRWRDWILLRLLSLKGWMILVDCECVHTVTVWFALKSSSPHILLLVQWLETVLLQLKFLHKLPSELTLPKKVPYCKKKNSGWWVNGKVLIQLKGIVLAWGSQQFSQNIIIQGPNNTHLPKFCVKPWRVQKYIPIPGTHLDKDWNGKWKKKTGIDTCELSQQPLPLCNTK